MSSPNAEIDLTAKSAKVIEDLAIIAADRLSETAKLQIIEVLEELDPNGLTLNNPFAEYLTDLESLIKGQKMMDSKTDMKAAANAFSRASQKLENKMQDASREEKLLYKDFQAKLASLPSWEQQNRAFRAEGNAIRATIQEFLNLPGDAQIRSLMNRGAEKTGSTS